MQWRGQARRGAERAHVGMATPRRGAGRRGRRPPPARCGGGPGQAAGARHRGAQHHLGPYAAAHVPAALAPAVGGGSPAGGVRAVRPRGAVSKPRPARRATQNPSFPLTFESYLPLDFPYNVPFTHNSLIPIIFKPPLNLHFIPSTYNSVNPVRPGHGVRSASRAPCRSLARPTPSQERRSQPSKHTLRTAVATSLLACCLLLCMIQVPEPAHGGRPILRGALHHLRQSPVYLTILEPMSIVAL